MRIRQPVIVTMFCLVFAADAPAQSAHVVVRKARIWTGDADRPAATALAVRDGKFIAVGDEDAVKPLIGDQTRVIDAGGRRVVPGLTDSHTHIISAGVQQTRVQLRDVEDRAEFIAAVQAYAATLPPDAWVLGGRWSTESWPDATPPTREWIDAATGGRPALLSRMDGHQALANSAALSLAGIDETGPPDPVGGKIDRRPETNEPTGILRDTAMGLVQKHIPPTSRTDQLAALTAAMREANRRGITMVHDMSEASDLAIFAAAHQENALTLRICVFVSVGDWSGNLSNVEQFPINDDTLRIAGFKGYMDGSLGSRTAYMREPYADKTSDADDARGLLLPLAAKEGELLRQCLAIDAAGLRPAVHAIGDEAVHRLLDAYEDVTKRNGPGDRRPRVEHAQHLLPSDIARFGKLGVVASMQPFHKTDDGRYAEDAIGAERCRSSYAFRDLLDAGAPLAFGSDWPVVTVNPFAGIKAAVTGKTLDGKEWMTHQNITVEEALRAYTAGPAWAARMEDRLGRIRPGFLADFVILEQDPFDVPPDRLDEISVQTTVVNGRVVFEATLHR